MWASVLARARRFVRDLPARWPGTCSQMITAAVGKALEPVLVRLDRLEEQAGLK